MQNEKKDVKPLIFWQYGYWKVRYKGFNGVTEWKDLSSKSKKNVYKAYDYIQSLNNRPFYRKARARYYELKKIHREERYRQQRERDKQIAENRRKRNYLRKMRRLEKENIEVKLQKTKAIFGKIYD